MCKHIHPCMCEHMIDRSYICMPGETSGVYWMRGTPNISNSCYQKVIINFQVLVYGRY